MWNNVFQILSNRNRNDALGPATLPAQLQPTVPTVHLVCLRMTTTDAVGSCMLTIARELSADYQVVCHTTEGIGHPGLRMRRYWAPRKPLAVRYAIFLLSMTVVRQLRRPFRGGAVWVVADGCMLGGDIAYAHMPVRHVYTNKLNSYDDGVRGKFQRLNLWLHAVVEPSWLDRSCLVVVPSSGMVEEIGGGQVIVVPNPCPPQEIVGVPSPITGSAPERDGLRIAFVANGRFEHKGLGLILAAVVRARAQGCSVVLDVFGGTQESTKIFRDMLANPDEVQAARWHGSVADVRSVLSAADAFCIASRYESFSMALAEAAQACLPIVATRTNGVAEALAEVDAMIVVERSVEDITRGLLALCALGPAGRKELGARASKHSPTLLNGDFGDRWEKIICEAFARQSSSHDEV